MSEYAAEAEALDEQSALIEAAKSGDEEAFTQLCSFYHVLLFGVVRSVVGNAADAEDIVQEAFCKAFFNIKQLRKTSSKAFRSWLYRIGQTTAASFLRYCAVRPCTNFTDLSLIECTEPAGIPMPTTDPLQSVLEAEEREQIEFLLSQLDPRDATMFREHYLDGLTQEEVAAQKGIPKGTVKSSLARARERLKQHVKAGGSLFGGKPLLASGSANKRNVRWEGLVKTYGKNTVVAAVRTLPEKLAELATLHYVKGFTFAQILERKKLARSTLSRRLLKARTLLAEQLQKQYATAPAGT